MGRDDVLDLPPAEVAEILKLHYGVTADTIEVVSGEIATVCRVASGPRLLAFKAIPAPGDTAALIRWQTSAMIKLARQGLPVPAVQPDLHGQPLVELVLSGGPILIQVSEWLTDPPLLERPGRSAADARRGRDRRPGESGLVGVHRAARARTAPLGANPHGRHRARAFGPGPGTSPCGPGPPSPGDLRPGPGATASPLALDGAHHDLHDSDLLVVRDRTGPALSPASWTSAT